MHVDICHPLSDMSVNDHPISLLSHSLTSPSLWEVLLCNIFYVYSTCISTEFCPTLNDCQLHASSLFQVLVEFIEEIILLLCQHAHISNETCQTFGLDFINANSEGMYHCQSLRGSRILHLFFIAHNSICMYNHHITIQLNNNCLIILNHSIIW